MSLVSGGQPVIGLETNMLQHITNLLKYRPRKKISKAGWISIDCEFLSCSFFQDNNVNMKLGDSIHMYRRFLSRMRRFAHSKHSVSRATGPC